MQHATEFVELLRSQIRIVIARTGDVADFAKPVDPAVVYIRAAGRLADVAGRPRRLSTIAGCRRRRWQSIDRDRPSHISAALSSHAG